MFCENDPALFDLRDNSTKAMLASLINFQKFYAPIHGRICVFLCCFGILTNILHCLILTRPSMRSSAVNCIMTAIALCDLGTMGSYLVYIVHFVLLNNPKTCSNNYTHGWMLFLLLHMFLSITLHTTALWLAVWMAFLRRMTLVRRNLVYSSWQGYSLAWKSSLVVAAVVFVLSIPSVLVHQIVEYRHDVWKPREECRAAYPQNYTEAIFTITMAPFALENGCALFKTNLWLTGILFKAIPCLLLLILSISLVQKLHKTDKNRQRLFIENGLIPVSRKCCTPPSSDGGANGPLIPPPTPLRSSHPNIIDQQQQKQRPCQSSDKTTLMLLAILTVFLLTEFPQGALAMFYAVYTGDVHRFLYLTLGDLLDLLSLVNSSVNFILYCLMSSRYRQTFCSVLIPISLKRYLLHMKAPFISASGEGGRGGGDGVLPIKTSSSFPLTNNNNNINKRLNNNNNRSPLISAMPTTAVNGGKKCSEQPSSMVVNRPFSLLTANGSSSLKNVAGEMELSQTTLFPGSGGKTPLLPKNPNLSGGQKEERGEEDGEGSCCSEIFI